MSPFKLNVHQCVDQSPVLYNLKGLVYESKLQWNPVISLILLCHCCFPATTRIFQGGQFFSSTVLYPLWHQYAKNGNRSLCWWEL